MIEQYIEEKDYQSALTLLKDLNDENTRYLRLVCLYGLGQFEQAKVESIQAKGLANDTYYEVISMYVAILKELGEYEEAINILIEELSMPYIPEPYGSLLNHAYDEVLLEKQENIDSTKIQTKSIYSDEEFKLILTKNSNQEVLMSCLEQLRHYNVRRLLPEVGNYLKDPKRDSLIKSLLIEIMIDQEIDEEFEIYKNNEYFDVNPIYLPYVFESELFLETSNLLTEHLEDQNPSLLQLCLEYLGLFLYDFYPKQIYDKSSNLVAASIHYYVATLQSISLDIDDISYLYQIDKDAVLTSVFSLKELQG